MTLQKTPGAAESVGHRAASVAPRVFEYGTDGRLRAVLQRIPHPVTGESVLVWVEQCPMRLPIECDNPEVL